MGARRRIRCRDHPGRTASPDREPDLTIVAVLGPTAAGKTDVAVAVAEARSGEILSVDSMQVYRGMDIGTAKASRELRARIPHHLIDIADPSEPYTVAEFQTAGHAVLDEVDSRGATAVIAGGSGLHFRALVDPLEFPPTDDALRAELEATEARRLREELLTADPDAGHHVDLANPRRVLRAVEIHRLTGMTPSARATTPAGEAFAAYEPVRSFVAIGLDPGDRLAERVSVRLDRMFAAGLLDEVARLAPHLGPTACQAVGYKELLPVVAGEIGEAQGRADVLQATLALAKRQRTFFRRDPRIRWIPWHDEADVRVTAALEALEEAPWIS